jgi:dihydropteroate synthase
MRLQCGRHVIDLGRPVVMGVLNVTPDSFSDGGHYRDLAAAVARGIAIAAEGAAIVDVGGESTRPGAAPVAEDEELRRVIPVIERLAAALPIPVSIDTRSPSVMRRAIAAGATLVNDVAALAAPGAVEAVAEGGAAACLMHMQGEPGTMQDAPRYGDVVAEVRAFLAARAAACVAAGIPRDRLLVDPGFGFGKSLEHNLALLAGLPLLAADGLPVLAGLSRKRMIGALTGRGDGDRLAGSLAAAIVAAGRGARVIRAHDVRETVDALAVVAAAGGFGDNRA